MEHKVLVVDDEPNIVTIIAYNLKKEGYTVLSASDGMEAVETVEKEHPDLILLDVMMPRMDGYEACKKIREKYDTPIIMLTARAEETDKVLGLELGADDYVTKPFGVRELMARVKANLRRKPAAAAAPAAESAPAPREAGLVLDPKLYEVRIDGKAMDLTNLEYELLKFLYQNKGEVFSRQVLLEKVWGYDYFGDVRTVDVTVRRLREKIEADSSHPIYIMTKRGIGYYFGG